MKYLLNTTEIYRVETEEEATELINEAKSDGNYILSKYSSVKKEQKSKGEVIDEWYRVTLVKTFNAEKEPEFTVDVIYEV
jgi:hypothetical protein